MCQYCETGGHPTSECPERLERRFGTPGDPSAAMADQTRTDGGQPPTGSEHTQVGHWMRDDCDVYAGRGRDGARFGSAEIGERGWLGNPYRADEHGREECIEKFRTVFERSLTDDEEFREAIRDLAGKHLGCWCQRLDDDEPACHGEVIAEWADRLAAEDDGLRADGSGETDPLEDQREQVSEFVDDDVIGYVAGDTEEAVTLCPDCEEEWDDEIPTSEIRDNPHYGDQVPYPECFRCGEVIRP